MCFEVSCVLGLLLALSLSACSHDKCEKAVDNSLAVARQEMGRLGRSRIAGRSAQQQLQASLKVMDRKMSGMKPQMVHACNQARKKGKRIDQALDCAIAAKDLQDLQKCGRRQLGFLRLAY